MEYENEQAESIQKSVGGGLFEMGTGKTIISFCTNEGSGMGSSEANLRKICKGAAVKFSLSICGHKAEPSEAQVSAWAMWSILHMLRKRMEINESPFLNIFWKGGNP